MINNRHFSKNIIYFDANKLKEEKITFTYLTNYDSYLIKIGYIILILIILLTVVDITHDPDPNILLVPVLHFIDAEVSVIPCCPAFPVVLSIHVE